MLCPEVCNFKAPEYVLNTIKKPRNQSSDEFYPLDQIRRFPFTHLVSVVFPEKCPGEEVDSLRNLLTADCEYYKVENIPLNVFVNEEFVDKFIKQGELTALSIGTRIDTDNCFAVSTKGVLLLSLTKQCYQTLGLQGQISEIHRKSGEKYVISIRLTDIQFNSKTHGRLYDCLSKLHFNVILSWLPKNKEKCPSSIAHFFHLLAYVVKTCRPRVVSDKWHGLVPESLQNDSHLLEGVEDELMQWCGIVTNSKSRVTSEHLNSIAMPSGNCAHNVATIQGRGFFTYQHIQNLVQHIRSFKWACIYVQGFSDAPVSKEGNEHHYHVNGDYGYFIHVNKCNWKFTDITCSNKRYK